MANDRAGIQNEYIDRPEGSAPPMDRVMMSGTDRRTLDARPIHSMPRRREWTDIVALFVEIAAAQRREQSRDVGRQAREVAGFYLL